MVVTQTAGRAQLGRVNTEPRASTMHNDHRLQLSTTRAPARPTTPDSSASPVHYPLTVRDSLTRTPTHYTLYTMHVRTSTTLYIQLE